MECCVFPAPNSASLEEMREVAARICRDYLHGAWKTISADDIKFRRISGGLSNFLYYVSLPDGYDNNNAVSPISPIAEQTFKRIRRDSSQQESEPKEVLLRIYGQSHGETAMLTELVVFTLLSERNLGPKLHGIFPGGRIEQYIPARSLKTSELANRKYSKNIAEKMAHIHSLNIPISKEPEWIWKTMSRWLSNVKSVFETTKYDSLPCQSDIIHEIRKTDLQKEVSWLKSVIDNANYPVVFCHNDLQEGNILIKETVAPNLSDPIENGLSRETDVPVIDHLLQNGCKKSRKTNGTGDLNSNGLLNGNISLCLTPQMVKSAVTTPASESFNVQPMNSRSTDCDPDLIIIDYEYCAYNYRGFDIANHFLEWTFDYTNEEFPYYFHGKQAYPTKKQRDEFITQYLRTTNNSESYVPSEEEMNELIEEIHCFTMASHLFWTLWSIVNVHQVIEFGYWDYALTRLREYREKKREYIELYMSDKPLDPK